MPLVGIFTQARPQIGAVYFDAVIEESTELTTEVTEFPIETGYTGNDHAVQKPLKLIMRVAVSDNPFRALRAEAADAVGSAAASIGANVGGAVTGLALSQVPQSVAVAAGLGGSVLNAAYAAGQASARSQSALDTLRLIQRANQPITVVGTKTQYQDCLITNTRQQTNKENEQALELVVDLTQLILVDRPLGGRDVPAPEDAAATQAQPFSDLGLLVPQ